MKNINDTGKILIEEADAIVTLTISRPMQANNLPFNLLRELHDAIKHIAERKPRPRVLILTGAGTQAFAGGLDPLELVNANAAQGLLFSELGQNTCNLLATMPIPTIAAVNGIAIGGGCELALACDLAFAATNARFVQIEVLAGLLPGFGGTFRLAQRIGTMRARRMIYTGELIDAETAKEWGLVFDVVAPEKLLERYRAEAELIIRSDSESIAEAKRAITAAAEVPWLVSSAIERRAFAARFETKTMHDAMDKILEADLLAQYSQPSSHQQSA